MGVFVSKFWVRRLNDERTFFILIDEDGLEELSHTRMSSIGALSLVSGNVRGLYCSSSEEPNCRTNVSLPEDMRFYMYSMILYADGFM